MGFSAALARQKLRDAAKLQQQDAAADKEMRPAVTHTSRAPAFLRVRSSHRRIYLPAP